MLTVRNSLLAISLIWMALVLWLVTSAWYDAFLQKTDATRILETNEVENGFLAAAHSWAVERGLSHAALRVLIEIMCSTSKARHGAL